MFHLVGIWHQVAALSEWTGLSVGLLAGLAFLVWLNPALLRVAIAIAIPIASAYFGLLYGNHTGRVDGRAEIQAKWDAQKTVEAKARAAELERQRVEAEIQKARDDEMSAALEREAKDALDAIAHTAPADDGPVPKMITDYWDRERAARGLK